MKTLCWLTLVPALAFILVLVLSGERTSRAGVPAADDADVYRAGRNFIPTPTFSEEEDRALLALFKRLRVADVSDGMDKAGLQNVGLVDPDIHPLWKDTVHFSHRVVGIAVTARYVPTNKPPAGKRGAEAFDTWVGEWYSTISPEPP